MSGKILDTTFFNTLEGDEASQEAFFLLQRRMFEAAATAQKVKDDAEATRVSEAATETKKAKTKAEKLAEDRETYFGEFGHSFLTDDLRLANRARKAAEAAKLRFSSYVEEEVSIKGKKKEVVGIKLKCVAQIPRKQNK